MNFKFCKRNNYFVIHIYANETRSQMAHMASHIGICNNLLVKFLAIAVFAKSLSQMRKRVQATYKNLILDHQIQ